MDTLDHLKAWLKDAYAMEQQSVQVLRRQSERITNYPELLARVKQHIEESERQGERMRQALQHLGDDTSALKTAAGMAMGNLQAISGALSSDEIVKAVMFSYMHEHYEIAAYHVLIATADECGKSEVRRLCETNLREEEEMQRWLLDHIEPITRQFIERSEKAPAMASR
ncbi:MAG TPA: ferritin-like domain-containing protein [Stellaceae bacterium]|nr:ferritin-like domain-containing protein [Stellaceae bacterium]